MMNNKLLVVVALSAVFVISCGKKEDLQAVKEDQPMAKKEAQRTVKPVILDADDKGSSKVDTSMTLSPEAKMKDVMPAKPVDKPIDAPQVRKDVPSDAPVFDTGIRPSNSK